MEKIERQNSIILDDSDTFTVETHITEHYEKGVTGIGDELTVLKKEGRKWQAYKLTADLRWIKDQTFPTKQHLKAKLLAELI